MLGQALAKVPGSPPQGWCPKHIGSCLGSGCMGWQEQPWVPPLIIRKMKKKARTEPILFLSTPAASFFNS